MGYKVNTKDRESIPAVGRYLTEVMACEWQVSKEKKTIGIVFKFRILSGEAKNNNFIYTYWLTERTTYMIATFMDALGLDGEYDLDPSTIESLFLGKRVVINLEHDSYKGKKKVEVVLPEAMTPEESDSVSMVPVKIVKGGVFQKRKGTGGGGSQKPTPTPIATSAAPVDDRLPEEEDVTPTANSGVVSSTEFPDDDIPF